MVTSAVSKDWQIVGGRPYARKIKEPFPGVADARDNRKLPHGSNPIERRSPVMSVRALLFLSLGLLLPLVGAQAQQDFDAVEIGVTPLRGGVEMISAAGGNLAVFHGPEGVLLVDADYAELSDRILSTIEGLGAENPAVRFLVNTHWHFDHTSGNENFVRAGATLIAHEGVGRLLSSVQVMPALGGQEVPAAPELGRPTVTFNDRLNLAFNGDLIHLVHMPDAHTDGDIIVHFRDADVVHMGDLFFNGMYPFIDVDNGGNLPGMVRAMEEVLAHSRPSTLFIPGHGPLADRSDLQAYTEMLTAVQDRVGDLIEAGMSREEVIAEKPTADFDPVWGPQGGGFMDPDRWVGLVYDGMVGRIQGS
jgi:glyoxylase-like metal-dependent hydrolase (beta-lactamase superfamily II)